MKQGFLLVLSCFLLLSCNQDRYISLRNTGGFSRVDEPVIISKSFLDSIYRKDLSDYFPLVINSQGDTIPSQTDDLNGDGKWDELFLICDFLPFEKKGIRISLIKPSQKPVFSRRANLRFAKVIEKGVKYEVLNQAARLRSTATELSQAAFQMEGPAWESDKIAFRNYFDARNGIDIYGKITSKMVLDSVGMGENYHNLQWWGMDILHVGNSLGAGAIGMLAGDTLYRLDLPGSGAYEAVSRGPLRVILRLTYNNWLVKDKKLNLVHEISTWGGFNGYQSKITLSGSTDALILLSGIVNLLSDTLYERNSHPLFTVIFTHAKQAENHEYLGLGLILPNTNYTGHSEANKKGPGIINSYLAHLKILPDTSITFRFYAGWEKANPEFNTALKFGNFLEREAEAMSRPILVRVEN
jgi:Domain of unknown function (DUF4861)